MIDEKRDMDEKRNRRGVGVCMLLYEGPGKNIFVRVMGGVGYKLTKGDVTEGTKRTGGGNTPLESSLPPDTPNLAWHG